MKLVKLYNGAEYSYSPQCFCSTCKAIVQKLSELDESAYTIEDEEEEEETEHEDEYEFDDNDSDDDDDNDDDDEDCERPEYNPESPLKAIINVFGYEHMKKVGGNKFEQKQQKKTEALQNRMAGAVAKYPKWTPEELKNGQQD